MTGGRKEVSVVNDALRAAIKCFQAESQTADGATTEQFNLYNGLALLAEGIGRVEEQIDSVDSSVRQITYDVNEIKAALHSR
jgi:hypothetical protein